MSPILYTPIQRAHTEKMFMIRPILKQEISMTCEEFFDAYMDGYEFSNWLDEMFHDDSYSSEKIFKSLLGMAKKEGVLLTDQEDWDYDKFFWNVWNCTEKGLS